MSYGRPHGKLTENSRDDVDGVDPDRVVEEESGPAELGPHDSRENQYPGPPRVRALWARVARGLQVLICLFTEIRLEQIPMLAGDERLLYEIVLECIAASFFLVFPGLGTFRRSTPRPELLPPLPSPDRRRPCSS